MSSDSSNNPHTKNRVKRPVAVKVPETKYEAPEPIFLKKKTKPVSKTTPVKAIKYVAENFHPDPDHGISSDTSGSESGHTKKAPVKKTVQAPPPKAVSVPATPAPTVAQQKAGLKKSLPNMPMEDPVYTAKGDKLYITEKDYNIKLEDSIIVVRSSNSVRLKLFTVSGNGSSHVSKRVIIKAVGSPTLKHTVECGQDNNFDFDPTRTVLTFSGMDVIRLQAAGKSWVVV